MTDVTLAVDAQQLQEIKRILYAFAPGMRAVAFGSRTTGRAQRFSDLDLAIWPTQQPTWKTIGYLREVFQMSRLPFSVDIVDGTRLPQFMQADVEQGVVLQQGLADAAQQAGVAVIADHE